MNTPPDFVGEILGYRAWRVETPVLRPPRLLSIFFDVEWEPAGWTAATCEGSVDGVPHDPCACGIYAARDRSHLTGMGYNDDADELIAIGEVALAGDVIPGERGWRAERGRPVRLWVAHQDWPLARPLSREYGVPVGLTNILSKGARRGHRT